MKKNILIIALVLVVLFITMGCLGTNEITGTDRENVLQYANPVADNLLEGFNEQNYEKFSRDFDEKMKNEMPESVYIKTRQMIVGKVGLYISKTLLTVLKKNSYISVIYNADFEKEKGVEAELVFSEYGEQYLVSGLWFRSPKLQ